MTIAEILSTELGQKLEYVENVITLMDEGNTIPFIARYRKEMHGAMDDTTLRTLETRLTYLRNLQERREEVKRSIENQGKLTEELSAAIDAAATMTEVEDLYRPYKQKRRTRASAAREKGLEPLAAAIFAQEGQDPVKLAEGFVDPEKGVSTVEEALQSPNSLAFLEAGRHRPEACQSCRYLPLCRGGCKRDWDANGANYYCSSYKTFVPYAITRLEEMAAALIRSR